MATSDDASESLSPVLRLAEYGWIIEPTGTAGASIRTHGALRTGTLCVSLAMLLLLSLFAWFMYGVLSMGDPPERGFSGLVPTLLLTTFLGCLGMPFAGLLAHIVWLLFAREEWEAGRNSLEIRRRLLGFHWGSKYQDGALLLEPHYDGREKAFWRLAVKSHGRKHYLIYERAISERGTGIGFGSTRQETEAMAELLAQYTGWPVISAQQEAEESVRSTARPEELPVALRERGFQVGFDEQLRLEIVRPRRSQIGCGGVALLMASIWLFLVCAAVHSFAQHVGGFREVLRDWPFLLLITPMLVGGVAIALLGLVILISRERWIVDQNLFAVRSRLLGGKSEQQYVDAVINLTRVPTKHDEQTYWTWEVQLHDRSGRVLKKNLYNDRNDDIPRQLVVVLKQHTGWPLVGDEP